MKVSLAHAGAIRAGLGLAGRYSWFGACFGVLLRTRRTRCIHSPGTQAPHRDSDKATVKPACSIGGGRIENELECCTITHVTCVRSEVDRLAPCEFATRNANDVFAATLLGAAEDAIVARILEAEGRALLDLSIARRHSVDRQTLRRTDANRNWEAQLERAKCTALVVATTPNDGKRECEPRVSRLDHADRVSCQVCERARVVTLRREARPHGRYSSSINHGVRIEANCSKSASASFDNNSNATHTPGAGSPNASSDSRFSVTRP